MPQENVINTPLATPVMDNQAAPADALQIKFSMDDVPQNDTSATVIKSDGVELKETPKETVEPKVEQPVAEKKVEPKKEQEVVAKKSALKPPTAEVKKPDGKEVIKSITPVKKVEEGADTFDYSKYAPQEVTNMKNMSRPSREAYAKLVDENKALSSLKDSTYLQHEQGYTLSPDYQQLQVQAYRAQVEGQCWKDAILAVRQGKPYQEITGFDKNNRPILATAKVATDEDELQLTNNFNACSSALKDFSTKLETFPSQFKSRVTNDLQAITQEQQNRFEWVKNPALLEHSVSIEGVGDVKVKDIKNNFKNLFPAYLANSPGVDVASNLLVAMQIQSAELRELQNQLQTLTIKSSEQSKVEPTSDHADSQQEVLTVNGKAIPKVFSLDGLPR